MSVSAHGAPVATPDPWFWQGRRVFLTGHTGFKGSWLTLWLQAMGTELTGYGLAPHTTPALFESAHLAQGMCSVMGDVRDAAAMHRALVASQAEIVLHLAAQPLVRASYDDPLGTYATNVMGTVHLLEAVRQVPGVKVVQVITSDKCYAPLVGAEGETSRPFRETDRLGGHDPYSSSKACVELVVDSYRRSFLAASGVHMASSRAGNVIGGGDWAVDRIVPDAIRALWAGKPIPIRSPAAVRPWQHVLEPLAGYLVLAEQMFHHRPELAGAFNFGPSEQATLTVAQLVDRVVSHWGAGATESQQGEAGKPEANYLKIDSGKSFNLLRWRSIWSVEEAVLYTVDWYRRVCLHHEPARQVCLAHIAAHQQAAAAYVVA